VNEGGDFPRVLGRYELATELGKGAMGRVFLARDPRINREVAIKAFDLARECTPEELDGARTRFLREAEAAGRLNHPNIVTIYDVGKRGGILYIAMEYVPGRRLSDFTSAGSLLPPGKVLELLAPAAEALHYAHSREVVHRDIKPANIMYDSLSNAVKLTDFGTARLMDSVRTRVGIVLGTPAYMSPEQLEGRNVNGHTDLFALGVTLFQLLTGELPFRGNSMTDLMFVIANEPHRPIGTLRADLPEAACAIVDKALAKTPVDRFRDGAEMAKALRHAAAASA
jgi:eukaryotic-like serine/threonine-protein kinase